jgi:hypothetical protein
MNTLKYVLAIALLLFVLISGEVIMVQGYTIEAQRQLIKEMVKNPQCLIPEGK